MANEPNEDEPLFHAATYTQAPKVSHKVLTKEERQVLIKQHEEKQQEAAKLAASQGGKTVAVSDEAWRKESVESRLGYALRKGIGKYMDADLHGALEKYPHAVDIIEGPLMDGMNEVGTLFGAGKMFLPQVVKTARTMKQAVAILQPYIEAEKKEVCC